MPILLLCGTGLEAQDISVRVRAGVLASSALVNDNVAGFGSVAGAPVSRELSVTPVPAPYVAGTVRARFWPRVALEAVAGWSRGDLRVSEEAGKRTAGTMTVLQGMLGATWAARPRLELGAAAGVIRHDGGDEGVLAGTSNAGLAEVSAGWVLPVARDRITVSAAAQTHRFGTTSIRDAGATDGSVARVLLFTTIRLF